ncbi:MAG: HAD family hydrolase [Patescibacteria group bacterium]
MKKRKQIYFDCWNTLFFNNLNPHPFFLFAEKLGQDWTDPQYVETTRSIFMTKKHVDNKAPICALLEKLNIKKSDELIIQLEELLNSAEKGAEPFEETLTVLDELSKKFQLIMVTNVDYNSYNHLNKKYKIEKYFDKSITSFDLGILKPNPEFLKLAVKKVNGSIEDSCLIGDSEKEDIAMADAMGMPSILINRKKKYLKSNKVIHSLDDLHDIL